MTEGTPLIPPQKEVRDDGPPPTLVMNARDAEIMMQHPDFIPSLATRIPAAIKRAKELVGPDDWYANDSSTVVVTATEIVLADELWGFANDGPCPPWPDALIAFTEKVEALE